MTTRAKPAEYLVEITDWVNGRRVVKWAVRKGQLATGKAFADAMTGKEARAWAASWNSARWGTRPRAKARVVKDDRADHEPGLRQA